MKIKYFNFGWHIGQVPYKFDCIIKPFDWGWHWSLESKHFQIWKYFHIGPFLLVFVKHRSP